MELDVIKQQTTWNDASNSINVNFSKIKQALALLEGANAGLNEEELIKFLKENGYATEADVVAQISSIVGGADSDHDTLLKIQLILQDNEIDLKNLNEKVDNIELDNGMFTWLDEEEHTTIFTEKNLVVSGDVSDGGIGEAVVGVTGILVGEDIYYGENGIVNLSAAIGSVDVNLSNYYTKGEVDKLIEGIQPDQDNNDMFTWFDEEHTTIITDKNLIVGGDISDGGVGEAVVGVTVIRINDDDYYDERGEGIIDISAAFGNIDIDLSEYYTKREVNELIAGLQPEEEDDMFYWLDEDTIFTEHNLVVNGDVSDGGTGEAVVGVTGILIGEEVYYGEDGIIDLSTAIGNVDVNLSNYYTIAEIDGLLAAYQPFETAINVDNIGAQSVAYADLADKANKAYSLVTEYDGEFIYLFDSVIYHVGDILPESNDKYFIGADEYFYKCVSANRFFAGSTGNNLWLLAGSDSGMKIIFGSADSCATVVDDRTRFAELGDDGLQLNVDLILGDTRISEFDNVVTLDGSLVVAGDVSSAT